MKNIKKWIKTIRETGGEDDGFSLIELMVVIVIMGLLTTVVVVNVMPNQDIAMVEKARADVRKIEQAINMYRMDTRRYPTLDAGLDVLKAAPGGLRTEPYLAGGLPKDPWGNDYQYLIPGENGRAFDVFSYGADGRLGGEGLDADVGNWIKDE